MRNTPVLDPRACTGCTSCTELCPEVFRQNEQTGIFEVVEKEAYPQACIEEAIRLCPSGCISWLDP